MPTNTDDFEYYSVLELPHNIKLPKQWFCEIRYCTFQVRNIDAEGYYNCIERYSNGSQSNIYRTKVAVDSLMLAGGAVRHCLVVNLVNPKTSRAFLIAALDLQQASGVMLTDTIDCKAVFASLSEKSLKGFLGTCAIVSDNDPYEVDTIRAIFDHVSQGGPFMTVAQSLFVRGQSGRL